MSVPDAKENICLGLFLVQLFEVRDVIVRFVDMGAWNCRPSLFNLSFYNINHNELTHSMPTTLSKCLIISFLSCIIKAFVFSIAIKWLKNNV